MRGTEQARALRRKRASEQKLARTRQDIRRTTANLQQAGLNPYAASTELNRLLRDAERSINAYETAYRETLAAGKVARG